LTTAVKTYYRPGLVFKAKPLAQGHQECCRKYAAPVYTPDGAGIVRDEIPALWAEFGVYGGEYTYEDPMTGATEIGSEFRGGYFDLDAQAAQKGWDDNEKEIVARHMLTMLNKSWVQFTLYDAPKVSAPWPTYDETHHSKVVDLAKTLGLVSEALLYEEQNKNRPSVVEGLRAALQETQAPAEELVAD
jgi:hypothetical protein